MKYPNVREMLIDRTIYVIATEGLDKTTTKAIVAGTGINEVYIYRNFANKEDLLSKAFEKLDEELAAKIMLHIPVMYMKTLPYKTRCSFFFSAIWRFILGNREKCLAYIRYYYSPYFSKYSSDKRNARYECLIKKFDEAFEEGANTWMLMNHILVTMLDFAVKIFDGELSDNDDTAEHVFRVVYYALQPYFKETEEC